MCLLLVELENYVKFSTFIAINISIYSFPISSVLYAPNELMVMDCVSILFSCVTLYIYPIEFRASHKIYPIKKENE